MSKRGMDAPLAEQMASLKKHMQKRDQRRDQDRQQRLVGASADDPYAQARARPAAGGVKLGPGAAAQAAVLNAAALDGPAPIRCELCQANFRSEAMLHQHEEGPAHKKALARDKARREREAWMENPSAAADALQAAAWLNGGAAVSRQAARPSQRGGRQGRGRQAAGRGPPAPEPPEAKPRGPSHAELIAQARRANEPLSINGWIPPALDSAAATSAAAPLPQPAGAAQAVEPPAAEGQTPDEAAAAEAASDGEQPGGGGALGLGAYGDSSDVGSGSSSGSEDSGGEPPPRTFESFF